MALGKAGRGVRLPVSTPAAPAPVDDEGMTVAYIAYRAAETVVRWLPRSVSYGLGAAGADVLTRLRPKRFSALRSNLRQVLPDADDAALEAVLRANVRNVARCWVDVMEMPHRPSQIMRRLDVIDGFDHYLEAAARGRGVVVVSLHLGAWETGLAAWNRAGGDLALLAEQVRPRRFFERIVRARESMGVTIIPIDAAAMRSGDTQTTRRLGATAMREVFKHLRAGNTIAIAIDRDITGGGAMLEFFGRPAPIPIGTVDVAIRAGAAVIPVALIRVGGRAQGWLYPEVTYDPDAPRDAEARRVASEVLRVFEGVIREHPTMWHVLDPIWGDAESGAAPRP